MKRVGILNALEKRHYLQMTKNEPEKSSSVTFKRVRVFFLLLGTGIIMAVLILILEIRVYRRKQNKRTEHRSIQNKGIAKRELVWKAHHPLALPLSSDRQEK
jgi:hypothetical protein